MLAQGQSRPSWMFNFSVNDETSSFRFVPTRLLLRSEVPGSHKFQGSVFLKTGEFDSVLRSAVWEGLQINLPQLKSIRDSLKLPVLKKGQGTGREKAVNKHDLAKQLINHLFPGASERDFKRMIDMLGPDQRQKPAKNTKLELEEDALDFMVSQLDTENAQEFGNIVNMAREKLIERARALGKTDIDEQEQVKSLKERLQAAEDKLNELKAAPVRANPSSSAKVGEVHRKATPADFRSLFSFAGHPGLSFKHDRVKKVCTVLYPCHLDLISECPIVKIGGKVPVFRFVQGQ